MHFLRLFLFIILIPGLNSAFAQDNIISDRPAQSFSARALGKSVFQAQHSLDFTRTEIDIEPVGIDPYSIIDRSYALTNFFRYGTGKSNELNAIVDFRQNTENGAVGADRFSGIGRLGLGFRQSLSKEKEILPASSILVVAHFNGILNEYRNFNSDGFALLLLEKSISNRIGAAVNLGINYNDIFSDNELYDSFLYTANLGMSFTDKLSGFVEAFGSISDGEINDSYDAGFAYLVNPKLQLDLFGGFSSKTNYLDYFISMGVSYDIRRSGS